MTNKNWIKSPWSISVGTAIFSLLLTMFYDYSKEKPILTTIWLMFKWTIDSVWSILNYDLKFYWIIIAIALLILALFIIESFKKEEIYKPDFYNYREDKIKKWKWSWSWTLNDLSGNWTISNMKAHCPKCDTPLINHSNSFELNFSCPRCNFIAEDEQCDEQYKIERIIIDNIERRRKENTHNK